MNRLINIRDSYDGQIIVTLIVKRGCEVDADKMQKDITNLQVESEDGISYVDILEYIMTKYDNIIEHIINVSADEVRTIWI